MVKILILDIETAPKVAYVWRFFKENIGAKQVREHGHIMSFAAKWLGEAEVFYEECRKENDLQLVKSLNTLLDEADMVVAHNGNRFDLPQIRARAIVHGLPPFSPVKQIDTCLIARKVFGFPSNSLEYLTEVLDCAHKKDGHKKFPGFELWLECLRGNEEAWEEMKSYNIDDVYSLEDLYLKMRPYMPNHPNVNVFEEQDRPRCPKCGSDHVHRRGFAFTQVGKYPRYHCQNCGGWSRGRYTMYKKNENMLANQIS